MCSALLDDVEEVGNYREYQTFTGTYKGTPVTICSHGVGGSGASVAFHELFQGGVKTVIRAGTCGAMQKGIQDGDMVIATGAIRRDGTTSKLIPMEYPAVAHYQVVSALFAACENNGVERPASGVVLTKANFYPGLINDPMALWMEAGVVAVEMEMATLLVMAGLRGLRAGGVLVSDGNLAEDQSQIEMEDNAYDPHRDIVKQGTKKMLQVALEALVDLD
jgi:uridine phosphorylase